MSLLQTGKYHIHHVDIIDPDEDPVTRPLGIKDGELTILPKGTAPVIVSPPLPF
jgi:hypothetical protein